MLATHFAKPEHARDYGEARALPADTLQQQWARILVGLVPGAGVRAVLDLGAGTGQLLPEDVFQRRLAEFADHCRTAPAAPVWEPVDLFVCQAP